MYTIDSVNVELKSLMPRVYHGEMKVVGENGLPCYLYMQYEKTPRGTTKLQAGLYDKSCLEWFDNPAANTRKGADDELLALLNRLDDEDPPKAVDAEEYADLELTKNSPYRAAYRRLDLLLGLLTPDHEVRVNGQTLNLRLNAATGVIRNLAADYDSRHPAAQSYDTEAEFVDDYGGRLYFFVSRIVPEDRKEYDRIFFRISRNSMQDFLSRQTREDTIVRREQYYTGHFGAPEAVVAEDAFAGAGKETAFIPQNVEGENEMARLFDAMSLQIMEDDLLGPMLNLYEEDGDAMKAASRAGELMPFAESLLDSLFDEPVNAAPAPEPEKAPAPEPAANPAETHPFGTRAFYELFGLTVKVPEDGLGHYEAEMSVRSDKDEPLYVYLSTAFEGNMEAIEDAEADRNFFGAVNRDSYLDEEREPGDALEEYNSFTECLASEYDYSFVLLGRALQAVTALMPELMTSEAAGIIRQLRIERVPLLPAGDEADPDACMDTLDAEVEIQKLDGERIFVYSSRSDTGKEEKQYFRVSKESWFDFIRMPLITFGPGFDPKTGRVAMPALVNGEEYTSDTEAEASAFARVYTLEDLFSAWVDLPVFYHQLKDETGAFKEAFI